MRLLRRSRESVNSASGKSPCPMAHAQEPQMALGNDPWAAGTFARGVELRHGPVVFPRKATCAIPASYHGNCASLDVRCSPCSGAAIGPVAGESSQRGRQEASIVHTGQVPTRRLPTLDVNRHIVQRPLFAAAAPRASPSVSNRQGATLQPGWEPRWRTGFNKGLATGFGYWLYPSKTPRVPTKNAKRGRWSSEASPLAAPFAAPLPEVTASSPPLLMP